VNKLKHPQKLTDIMINCFLERVFCRRSNKGIKLKKINPLISKGGLAKWIKNAERPLTNSPQKYF
jgi:hypothetical protein